MTRLRKTQKFQQVKTTVKLKHFNTDIQQIKNLITFIKIKTKILET